MPMARAWHHQGAGALREQGRAARADHPRRGQAEFVRVDRDPVELIAVQNATRVQDLVPLRMSRMTADPFAFFRGTAGLMAQDLARQPSTDVHVMACGDAHLGNFGMYASPERRLVFDLNDFDEAAPAPWEWDVRRLAASVVIAGRSRGFAPGKVLAAATDTVAAYRRLLQRGVEWPALERFYLRVDADAVQRSDEAMAHRLFHRVAQDASRRSADRTVGKLLTADADGNYRFRDDPPRLTRPPVDIAHLLEEVFDEYRETVRPDVGFLLAKYRLTDVARRVVGVGSVGTRCFVLALTGYGGEGMVLQVKEALLSVLAQWCSPNETTPEAVLPDAPHGKRVVVHQQVLQSVSDPFLGYVSHGGTDYYVRQFRDMKGSLDLDQVSRREFAGYARSCALLLGRAHLQSPAAPWVAGYLGGSSAFDEAVAEWAVAYAEQSSADFAAVRAACEDGRLPSLP